MTLSSGGCWRVRGAAPVCVCAQDDGTSSQGGRSAGGGDDEEEELVLSRMGCFLWLTGVTVFISFLSEFVTDAIRVRTGAMGI